MAADMLGGEKKKTRGRRQRKDSEKKLKYNWSDLLTGMRVGRTRGGYGDYLGFLNALSTGRTDRGELSVVEGGCEPWWSAA